uniref:Gamma-parvin n=1 Tax=Panthera leo TaxID=9689 RepID=A0A8C8XXB3_PANLE
MGPTAYFSSGRPVSLPRQPPPTPRASWSERNHGPEPARGSSDGDAPLSPASPRAGKAEMEPESLYNLLQLPKAVGRPAEEELPQGAGPKWVVPGQPSPWGLQVLMDWINARLLPEHIVVRSLEEDIFDGLILHHLFQTLTGLRLDVEEMALTVPNQRRKLEAVLEAVNRSLQAEDQPLKWSMDAIFNKDLLATLHLLVALAKRFQPDLPLPTNVQVEVITMEVRGWVLGGPLYDVFDELFKLAPEKVSAVKEAIVNFVNQKLDRLGLSVQNLDTQFADGVLLLLLIGQLEGFFLHLKEFYLTPTCPAEMLHNVTLVLELLKDEGLLSYPINPEGEGDTKSTLRVLYSLFRKHKLKENADSTPRGSPN